VTVQEREQILGFMNFHNCLHHLKENRNGEKLCNRNHISKPKALNLKSGNHTNKHGFRVPEYDAVSPGNQILF